MYDTNLTLGSKEFTSRLIVGTGKYASNELMRDAIDARRARLRRRCPRCCAQPH